MTKTNVAKLLEYLEASISEASKHRLFDANEVYDLRDTLKDWTQDELMDFLVTQGVSDYRVVKEAGGILDWKIVVKKDGLEATIIPNKSIEFIHLNFIEISEGVV